MWSSNWIRVSISEILQGVSAGALAISLNVSTDWRVFTYGAVLSVLTGILVGVWPAIKASLEAYCKANFTSTSRPSALLHLEEFPTGLTGKVQKVKIREWAQQQLQARPAKS